MKQSSEKWRHHVLERRLVLVFSLLVFGSIIVNSLLIYRRYSNDIAVRTANQTQQLLEQIALNIEEYIGELRRLCLSPCYSEEIMKLLDSDATDPQEQLEQRRTIEAFLRQEMTIPRDDIFRVFIISSQIYFSGRTGLRSDISASVTEDEWYIEAIEKNEVVFSPDYTLISGKPSHAVISVARRINSLSNPSKAAAVIRVDANYNGVKAVCDRVSLEPDSALFMVDDTGNVIYKNSTLRIDAAGEETVLSYAAATVGDAIFTEIGGTTYIINVQPIENTKWRIVSCNSMQELTKGMTDVQTFIMVMTAVFSLAGVVLIILVVRKFINPLSGTVECMEEAQRGNLSVRAKERGNDEITYLNRSFNNMIAQIKDMIEKDKTMQRQVYEANYLQKEAQYDALFNQIQPHFLFNTLNTISVLIKMSQNAEAISCIDNLSILLRGMVNASSDISMAEELKIVESYLSLQQKRHDQLRFFIDFPAELSGYMLPALTIQPIVENAIIHGLEPKHGELEIGVCVSADTEWVVIEISDNGVGMSAKALGVLREKLDSPGTWADAGGESIGLLNIQRRMKLKFGEASRLEISSAPAGGTCVTLYLPTERRDEHAEGTTR